MHNEIDHLNNNSPKEIDHLNNNSPKASYYCDFINLYSNILILYIDNPNNLKRREKKKSSYYPIKMINFIKIFM